MSNQRTPRSSLASAPNPASYILLTLVVGLALATPAQSADVRQYAITKEQGYRQTGAATVERSPGDKFVFRTVVYPSNPATFVGSASVRLPGSPTGNELYWAFDEREYLTFVRSSDDEMGEEEVTTLSGFDLYFPNGAYTLDLFTASDGGVSVPLTLTGNAYPPVPRITNFDAAQNIDAGRDFTLQWSAFTGGTAGDFIRLKVWEINPDPEAEDEVVIETSRLGTPNALNGLTRSYRIPAGTLRPERTCRAMLTFVNVTQVNSSSYPGVSGFAGYAINAFVTFATSASSTPDTSRPTLTVSSPSASFVRVTNSIVTVSGTASDAGGIAGVYLESGAGAVIQAGGTTQWSAELDLVPGTNVFRIAAVDRGAQISVTNVRTFFYAVMSPLAVVLDGSGTIAPRNYTNVLLEVGSTYTVTATPGAGYVFSNWTGGAVSSSTVLNFRMESNLVLQAHFIPNPFSSAAGSYNGLFFETDEVRRESSGFFSARVADSGSFTASLQIAGRRHPISGKFNIAGMSTNQIVRAGTNSLTVELRLHLDGEDQITGRVTDGEWTAELLADRAVFNAKTNPAVAFTGKYTLTMPGADDAAASPGGTGTGAVIVDAGGNLSFRGTLGDGTKVTQKVPLSRQGHWPIYLSLYRNQGSVLGWVTISDQPAEDMTGLLSWLKPSQAGQPYTNGFSSEVQLTGSSFSPPGTNLLFAVTNLMVIFTGGNLATPFTNWVALGANNKVSNTGSNKLTLTVDTRTGLFAGKVVPPGRTKAVPFNGAILQKQGFGDGCFLGTNQSGRVYFGSGTGLTNPATATNLVLSLDGDGDTLTVPSSPELQNPDEITVEAWIYPQSPIDNPNHGYFILKGDGVSLRSYEFDWVVNGGNTGIGVGFECNLFTGTSSLAILGVAAQETNWYHVAFTYKASSGEFKLYTNGVLAAQTTTGGQPLRQTTQDLKFGGFPFAQARGELDEVRIWNKARTQVEIQGDFGCRLAGSEAGLAGYWIFDDGTANDQTGNGHHGTLAGNAIIQAPSGADLTHQTCLP